MSCPTFIVLPRQLAYIFFKCTVRVAALVKPGFVAHALLVILVIVMSVVRQSVSEDVDAGSGC